MASYTLVRTDSLARFQLECDLKMGEGFIPAGGFAMQGSFFIQAFYKLDAPKPPPTKKPTVKQATKKTPVRRKTTSSSA